MSTFLIWTTCCPKIKPIIFLGSRIFQNPFLYFANNFTDLISSLYNEILNNVFTRNHGDHPPLAIRNCMTKVNALTRSTFSLVELPKENNLFVPINIYNGASTEEFNTDLELFAHWEHEEDEDMVPFVDDMVPFTLKEEFAIMFSADCNAFVRYGQVWSWNWRAYDDELRKDFESITVYILLKLTKFYNKTVRN